jgi:hypothetical protein
MFNGLHATAQAIGINTERLPLTPTIGKWYYLPLIGKPNSNTSGRAKALGTGVVYLQNMATGDKVTHFDGMNSLSPPDCFISMACTRAMGL